jgi:hypothetical protein
MAEYKNQHFVPKCLLRQFSSDEARRSLSVFNIRSERLIPKASLKSQSSSNYTPRYAAICYDNHVYTAPDLVDGRLVVKRDEDANAINELQFLKAAENIYFKDWETRQHIVDEYARYKGNRRDDWSVVTMLVPDDAGKDGAMRRPDGTIQNYRVGTREEGMAAGSALMRMSFVYPVPSTWFPQLKYRGKPKTFYNGTAVGHVRKEEWLRSRDGYPG